MRLRDRDLFLALLRTREISQNELARQVGLSQAFMSDVAHGRKRVDDPDARRIARTLGFTCSRLFSSEPLHVERKPEPEQVA